MDAIVTKIFGNKYNLFIFRLNHSLARSVDCIFLFLLLESFKRFCPYLAPSAGTEKEKQQNRIQNKIEY